MSEDRDRVAVFTFTIPESEAFSETPAAYVAYKE